MKKEVMPITMTALDHCMKRVRTVRGRDTVVAGMVLCWDWNWNGDFGLSVMSGGAGWIACGS